MWKKRYTAIQEKRVIGGGFGFHLSFSGILTWMSKNKIKSINYYIGIWSVSFVEGRKKKNPAKILGAGEDENQQQNSKYI